MRRKPVLCMIFILLAIACRKREDPCQDQQAVIDFSIYEKVGDTILVTDTVFVQSNVFFKTKGTYTNIQWKIGDDPRAFATPEVNLYFPSAEILPVALTASINNACQLETRTVHQSLVIVPHSSMAPIAGSFTGYNTDKKSDTFTVTVKYWYGQRYNWWPTGAYTIHNLPRGFRDSMQSFNGYARPEIDGIVCANGYKNLFFDKSGSVPAQGIKGCGSLKRSASDSIVIDYTVFDLQKFNQTGQIAYIAKKFIGKRN